jgi:hypothetical protein
MSMYEERQRTSQARATVRHSESHLPTVSCSSSASLLPRSTTSRRAIHSPASASGLQTWEGRRGAVSG